MKKLSIVLAAMLVLALLCSCAKPAPEAPAQADPEPEVPAAVHVTTFPAEILSAADDMLMVGPTDADSTFGTASSVAVRLADGLVPVGADGWPIAVSELTPELQVDITYLGDIAASDPPEVLAVAIRVIPTEQPTTEPDTTTPVQPAEPAQQEPEQATVQQPAEPAQPDENRYMNEEDQKHDQTPEPEQNESSVSCTSLTLSAPTVTFEEAGRFFNITFTRTTDDCTEPVAFSSSDETVATVSEQGKIIAVNAGSAVITAQCGEQTAQCLVTCDFAYVGTGAAEGDPAELALNKDDLTFMNAGEQYTLSVTGAPDGAKITWQSSDESIVTVSENGVLTAKGKGTATVKAAVDDSELTCIVRCNFEDRSGEGECTISNSDVTMGVKGETFQISLRDADGNKITGLLWVSSDLSVCSVDGTGVVKAEGKGTAYVSTTYNGVTYQCIVRCNIK